MKHLSTESMAVTVETLDKKQVQHGQNLLSSFKPGRICPALPLTAETLREKIYEVADPALKYCSSSCGSTKAEFESESSVSTATSVSALSSKQARILSTSPVGDKLTQLRETAHLASIDETLEYKTLPTGDKQDHSLFHGSASKNVLCESVNVHNSPKETDICGKTQTKFFEKVSNYLPGLGPSTKPFVETVEIPTAYWWDTLTSDFNACSENVRPRATSGQNGIEEVFATVTASALHSLHPSRKEQDTIDAAILARQIRLKMNILPRKLRIEIYAMAIGIYIDHVCINWKETLNTNAFGLRTSGGQYILSNEYSKATNSFRRAPKITRRRASKITHYSVSETPTSVPHIQVSPAITNESWFTLSSPEELLRWCAKGFPKDQHCCIALNAVNVLNLGYHQVWENDPWSINLWKQQAASDEVVLARLLTAWVMALRRLPPETNHVFVNVAVPIWVDQKELDIYLSRMWCVAKFRTQGQVSWAEWPTLSQPLSVGRLGNRLGPKRNSTSEERLGQQRMHRSM